MIDFALAVKQFRKVLDMRGGSRWDIKFGTGVIANPTAADQRELSGSYRDIPDSEILFMEDPALDNELRTDYRDRTSLLKERPYSEKLPDEVLILLPLRVYGFSLHNRTWHAFDITKVQDIEESGHGFENLVLSKEHKKIVQALVQNHKKGRIAASPQAKIIDQDFSMDLVRGKGKGLIILLHGVPGTGKTSTAECVAVQTKRPLFPVTCGDIGTQPAQVEERLNEYFDMAHKWGCVLLLDEADVFLAQREKGGDLVRNGVVSGIKAAQNSQFKLIMTHSISPGSGILCRHSHPHYQSNRRI